jgi:hypothetical protein
MDFNEALGGIYGEVEGGGHSLAVNVKWVRHGVPPSLRVRSAQELAYLYGGEISGRLLAPSSVPKYPYEFAHKSTLFFL